MAGEQSTTPTGVQPGDRETGHVDESKDRPLTPREVALEAIKQTRLQVLSDEIVEGNGEKPIFGDPEPDPVRQEADRKPADKAVEKAVDKPGSAVDEQVARLAADDPANAPKRFEGDSSKTLVRVKIDGDEIDLPLDKVISNYQKDAAASRRMTEATRITAEANRMLDEAKKARPAVEEQTDPAKTPDPTKAASAKDFSAALFEGDEDKAAAAFEAAVDARVAAAVQKALKEAGRGDATPDLVDEVTNRVRQQSVVDSALARSRSDYPELYADPDVEELAAMKIKRRMDEGIPFVDALVAVETEFATKNGWTAKSEGRQQERSAPNRDRNERLERKKGIDSLPAANVRRSAPASDSPPPLDESERASRGIAQLRAGRPEQSLNG